MPVLGYETMSPLTNELITIAQPCYLLSARPIESVPPISSITAVKHGPIDDYSESLHGLRQARKPRRSEEHGDPPRSLMRIHFLYQKLL